MYNTTNSEFHTVNKYQTIYRARTVKEDDIDPVSAEVIPSTYTDEFFLVLIEK